MSLYFDYNATTPLDERVFAAMEPYFKARFGNAASATHAFGWQAAEAVKMSRESIAKAIGARPEELIFTSGSTEGNNLALKGVAERYGRKGNHIVTVATEHKTVLDTCSYLEKSGFEVTYLPVNKQGQINLDDLEAAMSPQTVLVSAMLGNNETGTILPFKAIAEIVHRHQSILMSDATQAVGKIPVDVNELGIDLMVFNAHKLYGPKGVGAVYVRRRGPRVVLAPQLHGGGHERGFRSGTLNVPGIVGFAKAVDLCVSDLAAEWSKIKALRDRLETGLLVIPGSSVNGDVKNRLPNVTNIGFKFVEAEALLMAMPDLAMSTGSACTSAVLEPSHVLRAMGLNDGDAYASLRLSLGRFTTEGEVEQAIESIGTGIQKLRTANPLWEDQVLD